MWVSGSQRSSEAGSPTLAGEEERRGGTLGSMGQAEDVARSREPGALPGGASEDFSWGSEYLWSFRGQVRPGVMAVRPWGSEEGRPGGQGRRAGRESQKKRKKEGAGAK